MTELNLKAEGKEQELILDYLKANASKVLAEKINSGVCVEKDGKRLINKKTLSGFMRYACEEAKKQAEKGACSACIQDSVVFGWAVHYFQEDEIIGNLYNEDGTEYISPVAQKTVQKKQKADKNAVVSLPTTPKKAQAVQLSLFDAFEDNSEDDTDEAGIYDCTEDFDDVSEEAAENIDIQNAQAIGNCAFQSVYGYNVNTSTGEVIETTANNTQPTETVQKQTEDPYADKELLCKLYMLLDQRVEIVKN